jgi:hypothetical protein
MAAIRVMMSPMNKPSFQVITIKPENSSRTDLFLANLFLAIAVKPFDVDRSMVKIGQLHVI